MNDFRSGPHEARRWRAALALSSLLSSTGCLSLELPPQVTCDRGVCQTIDGGSSAGATGGGTGGEAARGTGGAADGGAGAGTGGGGLGAAGLGTGGDPGRGGGPGSGGNGTGSGGATPTGTGGAPAMQPPDAGVDRAVDMIGEPGDGSADAPIDASVYDVAPGCVGRTPGSVCVAGNSGFVDVVSSCSADLTQVTTTACPGLCVAGACVAPRCGDGKVQAGEACDDGNDAALDGCHSCKKEWIPIAGAYHVCARSAAGVICWGANQYAQCGNGTTNEGIAAPTTLVSLSAPAVVVGTGFGHSCALLNTGDVQCWGLTDSGQLGTGSDLSPAGTHSVGVPVAAAAFMSALKTLSASVKSLAVGGGNTCVSTDTGKVLCLGENSDGALGDGTSIDSLTPVSVDLGGGSARSLATNGGCAILTNNQLLCWGRNQFGQMGNGTSTADSVHNTPSPVALPTGVIPAAVVGADNRCALSTVGEVWCWGYGVAGQLGDGKTEPNGAPPYMSTVPVKAALPAGAVATQVAAGASHFCAVLEGGDLYCWGNASFGQLGIVGLLANSPLPLKVNLGSAKAKAVATGSYFTCALLDDDKVYCWGLNDLGALGYAPLAQGETVTAPNLANPVKLPY